MRSIRVVVVKEKAAHAGAIRWKRVAAGAIVALCVLFSGITVVYALHLQRRIDDLRSGHTNGNPVSNSDNTPLLPIETIFITDTLPITTTNMPTSPTAMPAHPNTQESDTTPQTQSLPSNTAPLPTTTPVATLPTNTPRVPTQANTLPATNTPLPPAATSTSPPLLATPIATTATVSAVSTIAATDDTNHAIHTATPTMFTTPPIATPDATTQTIPIDTNTPLATPIDSAATPAPTMIPVPVELSLFGAEITSGAVASVADDATTAQVDWVRYNGILWHEVEAKEGSYNWAALSHLEEELAILYKKHLTPVVVIRGTPDWAQQHDALCGPIRNDKLDQFGQFVYQVVKRYSGAPYFVRYWEIGNEPDVDFSLVDETMPFGCWGDKTDEYYGGGYYATMLKVIYPQIKQANPNAVVVLGGLLLDCDPAVPPIDRNGTVKDCRPARFLEGVLHAGGGNAFDVVTYHGYAYWQPTLHDWDKQNTAWQHRGGALLGKAEFIRSLLNRYHLEKPLLANEIGLLCHSSNPNCNDPAFLLAQQNYLVRTYTRAIVHQIQGTSWYSFNYAGWQEAGLLSGNKTPRPAYFTFAHLAEMMRGATLTKQLTFERDTHEGYVLHNTTHRYTIVWSNDDTTFTVEVPTGTTACYRYGTAAAAASGYEELENDTASIEVGFEPVIIVTEE